MMTPLDNLIAAAAAAAAAVAAANAVRTEQLGTTTVTATTAAAPLPQFKGKGQPPGTEKRRGPGRPPKKKSDPGYVKVLSFAGTDQAGEVMPVALPLPENHRINSGPTVNKGKDKQAANAAIAPRGNKGQVDKDLYIESVGEFAGDLIYESESDGDDEVDPVEGEDATAGEAEAQGDQIHEVISVRNSETLSFANLMLELVAAPPVAGTSAAGADAVNDEIKAFEQEYKTFEREYEAYIETMVKNPPKAESTQRSYKSWLARWKAFCLKNYKDADMPFEVEEYKAHVFFKDVVFTRTTTKTFHDMSCKTKKVLVDRLTDGSRQPTYLQPASDQHWRNSDQGQTGTEGTPANVVQRVVDMEMFLLEVPKDKDGKQKIVCPLAYQTVVMARKAITYLHVETQQQIAFYATLMTGHSISGC
ncbi:hypothetical protein BGZ82_004381 [Podila clonocystis]|nr:hypothetical protein BGZ82_004381 [Podila clonocystis]